MASTKKFANLKKPVRQPTPEQIAAFEETGRVAPSVKAETQKPANAEFREDGSTEIRKAVDTEARVHGNAETLISANEDSQQHRNPPSRKSAKVASQKSSNTETRISDPNVRLTIDLPESAHTRFKTACARSKRKMVDEVRDFIEQRTIELEGEAG